MEQAGSGESSRTALSETDQFLERMMMGLATDDPRAAVEEKVDQLLSSPAFGERWGRHWLDLARYADSTGGGRAIPLPDAWRFRDYVIDAFNDDRPLNQLIREHIAGDLLPADGEGHGECGLGPGRFLGWVLGGGGIRGRRRRGRRHGP